MRKTYYINELDSYLVSLLSQHNHGLGRVNSPSRKEMHATEKMPPGALFLKKSINVPKSALWDYVSTAEGLSCWQADEVSGGLSSGHFSLSWPSLGAHLDLMIENVRPGSELSLRAGTTLITVLVEDGSITLTHDGLSSDDDREGFLSSWETALSLLGHAATRHPKKQRSIAWLFQEVDVPAELLCSYFTVPSALSTWLGLSGSPLTQGTPYQIELVGKHILSGDVLYAGRDVSLSVREWDDGVLTLRSLPGPLAARVVALGISSWTSPVDGHTRSLLEGALRRLNAVSQPSALT